MPKYRVTYRFLLTPPVNCVTPVSYSLDKPPVLRVYREVEADDEEFAADQALFIIHESYSTNMYVKHEVGHLSNPELVSVELL